MNKKAKGKVIVIFGILLVALMPLASAGLLGDVWAWLFGEAEQPEGINPEDFTNMKSANSERICEGTKCETRLYSGIQYVDDNGEWKKPKKVKSLKDKKEYNITYIKLDPLYIIKVLDYNYTSITAEFSVSNDYDGSLIDIPIKINDIEIDTTTLTNKNDKYESTYPIDFNNFNLTFGFASTTITIAATDPTTSWLDEYCTIGGSCTTTNQELFTGNNSANWYFTYVNFIVNESFTDKAIENAEIWFKSGTIDIQLEMIVLRSTSNDTGDTAHATNRSVIYNTSKMAAVGELFAMNITTLFQSWANGTFDKQGLIINVSNDIDTFNDISWFHSDNSIGSEPYVVISFDTTTTTLSTSSTTTSSTTTTTSVPGLTSEVNLYLNSTQGNVTVNISEVINITGYLITPPSLIDYLWVKIDGILIQNNTGVLENLTQSFTKAGSKNVSLGWSDNATYSIDVEEWWIDVVDTTNPIIIMDSPIQANIYTTVDQDINYTLTELDANRTYYSLDNGTTNVTIAGNTTVTFPFGLNNLFLFHMDNSSNEDNDFVSFNVVGFNSLNYTKDLGIDTNIDYLEFEKTNFSLNVTPGSTSPTARLIFNNIAFNSDLTDIDGNQTYFSRLLALPETIDTSLLNNTFKFSWNITWNGSLETNTTTEQITIWRRFLGTCDLTNTTTVNFTIQDEETSTEIIEANYSLILKTLQDDSTIISEFNLSFIDSNSAEICISPSWGNFTVDVLVEYSASTYDQRRYELANQIFDNSSRNVILNLLLGSTSTEVTVNVRDQDDNNLEGYTIEFFRFIVSENRYDLVETAVSDFEGKALFRLDKEPTYRGIISLNGVEVIRKDNIKIIGTNPELFFIIPIFGETPVSAIDSLDNLTYSLLFNKTGIDDWVNFTFEDPNDLFEDLCLRIVNFTVQDTTTITDSCSNSDDSSINFNMTAFFGSNYLVTSYAILSSGDPVVTLAQLEIDLRGEERLKFYGDDSLIDDKVFFTLAIVGTMGGIGLSTGNPAITIIMSIFGLLIAFWLKLTAFSTVAIISVVVMGGFLIYLLKT